MKNLEKINARLSEILPIYEADRIKSIGWEEVFSLRQAKADLLRPTVEVVSPEYTQYNEESQIISKFNVGDLVAYHGLILKVDEIICYENTDNEDLPVYVLHSVYQSGSLGFFNTVIGSRYSKQRSRQMGANNAYRLI
jgi:hypothetical protein